MDLNLFSLNKELNSTISSLMIRAIRKEDRNLNTIKEDRLLKLMYKFQSDINKEDIEPKSDSSEDVDA